MSFDREADEAYWNQTEHPALVERVCVCGEPHLNDPLVQGPMCPKCLEEYICGS